MPEAPTTVRAVARGGAAPASQGNGPATLVRRSVPGYLGAASLVQLFVVELALIAVISVLRSPLVVVIAGSGGALLIVIVLLARWRGRWWTERMVLSSRYRRRRGVAADGSQDGRLRGLRRLAPGLTVENTTASDESQVGVGVDDAGWYAALVIGDPNTLRGESAGQLPVQLLTRQIAELGQPGASLQVVVHTVPTPHADLDPRCLVATSYRELSARDGQVPASRTVWVAARIDARTLAEAMIGGADETAQVPTTVAAMIRRVGRALERAGVANTVLDAGGLLDALAHSCDIGRQPAPSATAPHEEWTSWRSARYAHVSYWLRQWPALPAPGSPAGGNGPGTGTTWLLRGPAIAGAAATSVALLIEPAEEGVRLRCVTRVTASPNVLEAGCMSLLRAADQAGADLYRLDGEHAPAVYASAPTGGGGG
jgi:type VII secretion protein EccE